MSGFAEHRRIATVALVVANYDEAIAWYVERLGFLLVEDVDLGGHAAMLEKGVEFREAPRFEPYGTVAVFADLHGNLWDLIEPKR
ncbi:VOC family protein [Mesorhizobium sp.]|uniref:VOC family protein n=1 Tax=Mesorhizobium sp. TaxID=1871066 RepID=UPI000FE8C029|nr:VOC family protein [Mesorhizobium sp.]RWO99320.1 MAG: hypothetical protein EOQ97_27975 [Mesorhizobium sp.]